MIKYRVLNMFWCFYLFWVLFSSLILQSHQLPQKYTVLQLYLSAASDDSLLLKHKCGKLISKKIKLQAIINKRISKGDQNARNNAFYCCGVSFLPKAKLFVSFWLVMPWGRFHDFKYTDLNYTVLHYLISFYAFNYWMCSF